MLHQPACPQELNFEYEPRSQELYEKFLERAGWTCSNFLNSAIMSVALTVANVIMVALGASLMFRIKEVLPVQKKIL